MSEVVTPITGTVAPHAGSAAAPAPPEPAKPPAPLSSRHHPQLDGLRGLAMMMIFAFHFVVFARKGEYTSWFDKAYYSLSISTWGSVDLFFILSGFLITGILLDTRGKAHYFRNFYMRRLFRIFPLYYGALVLSFLILPHFIDFPGAFYTERQAWFWLYVSNWATAFRGAWAPLPYLDHFWTLSIEEQFYLMWPMLVLVIPRRGLVALAVSLLLACLALRLYMAHNGRTMVTIYTMTVTRLDSLAVGGMIAALARGPGGFEFLTKLAKPALVVSAAILGVVYALRGALDIEEMISYTYGFTLMQMFFGSLLVLCLVAEPGQPLYRIFASGPFNYVGELSYGIYVCHYVAVIGLCVWTTIDDGRGTILGSQVLGQWRLFLAMTFLTWLGGFLSWHCWEKHFLKLKRYFPSGK